MVHLSVLHQKVIAVNEIVLYGVEGEGEGRGEKGSGQEKGGEGRGGKGRGGRGLEVVLGGLQP